MFIRIFTVDIPSTYIVCVSDPAQTNLSLGLKMVLLKFGVIWITIAPLMSFTVLFQILQFLKKQLILLKERYLIIKFNHYSLL